MREKPDDIGMSAEEAAETPQSIDWNSIVRNSFLVSQGLYVLQTPLTRWLAMGPLHDQYLKGKVADVAQEHTQRYATRLIQDARHHTTRSEISELHGGIVKTEVEKVIDNFQYELDAAFSFSPEERARAKNVALVRIAEGLIQRDRLYLLEREGRPIGDDSHRDKWSSFIIDFGILHKGDGLYTWNGIPEPFKELWEEVMPIIRQRHHEDLGEVIKKYLEMHPDLSEDEQLRVRAGLRAS